MTTAVKSSTNTSGDGSKGRSQPGLSVTDGMDPGVIVISAIKSYPSHTIRSSGPYKLIGLRF